MDRQLQAIATLLSLVNPLMCGAMFTRLESGRPRSSQIADATKATTAVLVILVLAALFGTRILEIFGVSLDAFSVAGGGVLSWIGFSMLSGRMANPNTSVPEQTKVTPVFTPLVLFAASPGTITGVITLTAVNKGSLLPITALIAIVVAAAAMWITILVLSRSTKRPGEDGFVRDTATRFMGLIVIAMGVQFALTGLRAFMAGR